MAVGAEVTTRRWTSRLLNVGDAVLHYYDGGAPAGSHVPGSAGEAHAVVILHGLAGSGREFLATAEALPEYRVVLPDLRGHGQSTRKPSDVSREAFVADTVKLVESLDAGPVAVVGQSMGAHTAMLVAAARPDLVQRLVLLECDAGGTGPEQGAAELAAYFSSWPVPFADRKAAAEYLGSGPLQQAWVEDLETRDDGLWPRFDAGVMGAVMAHVDAMPRWAEWESIGCPVLVVYGEQGMFSERQRAEFVRRGRNVVRVDLPGASHDAHLDAAEEWTACLRGFLNS